MADFKFIQFADQYEILEFLNGGSFGEVFKSRRKDTGEIVAVKKTFEYKTDEQEILILQKLMCLNFDQHNIVKFCGWFNFDTDRKALVFEMLDVSLFDFHEKNSFKPLLLSDIRDIIQQVATALCALQSIGVIHADVKDNNIMLVDHQLKPMKVKLIDFSMAIHESEVTAGMKLGTFGYLAPEIILGLPFNGAMDMFSLGCVMAILMSGFSLFETYCEDTDIYESLYFMITLLGNPRQDLLNIGEYTANYFIQTSDSGWRLKTLNEYNGMCKVLRKPIRYLDELKGIRLMKMATPDEEWKLCVELLKSLLNIHGDERITARKVLAHPFIACQLSELSTTGTQQDHSSPSSNKDSEPPDTPLSDRTYFLDSNPSEPPDTPLSSYSSELPVTPLSDRMSLLGSYSSESPETPLSGRTFILGSNSSEPSATPLSDRTSLLGSNSSEPSTAPLSDRKSLLGSNSSEPSPTHLSDRTCLLGCYAGEGYAGEPSATPLSNRTSLLDSYSSKPPDTPLSGRTFILSSNSSELPGTPLSDRTSLLGSNSSEPSPTHLSGRTSRLGCYTGERYAGEPSTTPLSNRTSLLDSYSSEPPDDFLIDRDFSEPPDNLLMDSARILRDWACVLSDRMYLRGSYSSEPPDDLLMDSDSSVPPDNLLMDSAHLLRDWACVLSDRGCRLSHRACCLMDRACRLKDREHLLNNRACLLMDRARFLMDRARLLMDRARHLMDGACLLMEKAHLVNRAHRIF